jgi:hypothetical protein
MNIFTNIFNQSKDFANSAPEIFICIGAALIIGVLLAAVYAYKSKYTQSFVFTLATLPAIVSMVILLVNGNIGAGIAVAGTFSLVRFRSVAGTAKEIGAIFMAMAAGLAIGMGYIGYAAAFSVIMCLVTLIYVKLGAGLKEKAALQRSLLIVIPESLDYTDVFDEILSKYTTNSSLESVKTSNMGSLFKLNYDVTMKKGGNEKEFIDELRCRNGNLEIRLSRISLTGEGL